MPWEVHHVFFNYSEPAIKLLKADPFLGRSLYHVTDLNDFEWYDLAVRHGLPDGGLIISKFQNTEWGRDPDIWGEIPASNAPGIRLPYELLMDRRRYVPGHVLQYLKRIQLQLNVALAYYYCIMQGEPEDEYAFVFSRDDKDAAYIFTRRGAPSMLAIEDKKVVYREGDVLVECLKYLGLNLPTGYFAPHTGYFDWDRFEISHR